MKNQEDETKNTIRKYMYVPGTIIFVAIIINLTIKIYKAYF